MKSKNMVTLKILLLIAFVIMTAMIFMPKKYTEENVLSEEYIDENQNDPSFLLVEDVIKDNIRDSLEWNAFILAVAMEESRWQPSAHNGDAVGFLQIRPVCVNECNRILGYEEFTLEDRWSRERSIEMWHIIQNRHNPTHDHDKALDIWNPNHPEAYKKNIQFHYDTMITNV